MPEKPYVVAENSAGKLIVKRGRYYTFIMKNGDPLPTQPKKWRNSDLLYAALSGGYEKLDEPREYKPKKG